MKNLKFNFTFTLENVLHKGTIPYEIQDYISIECLNCQLKS